MPDAADNTTPSSSSGTQAISLVLVVDDDPLMATNLVELLLLEGYEAHAVHSGEKALEVVIGLQPDVILSDVKLPGMDGESLLQNLRSSPDTAHIPLIFMTGYAEKTLSVEADGYLSKPFKITEVLDVFRQLTDQG
jgi:CheY-like chemotaxis protein